MSSDTKAPISSNINAPQRQPRIDDESTLVIRSAVTALAFQVHGLVYMILLTPAFWLAALSLIITMRHLYSKLHAATFALAQEVLNISQFWRIHVGSLNVT
ncbi:hypothetical protein M0R45_007660 [Rubus argutus]|uniref:Uncharacterized protein n=1 Tax=Rubus argutus TaxID=59490 RepID=A0AAW1Y1F2_RUBAR